MRLEYYFDFTCPFAYLGSFEVEELARRTGAELVWRPMLLGGVLRAVGAEHGLGNEPLAKRVDHLVDMRRWSEVRGLPLAMPPGHPQRSVRALRTLLAVDEARWPAMIHELYRSYWERGEQIGEPEALTRALGAAGLDGAEVERALAATDDAAIKDELRRRTDEAVARGVFGAPTLFVHTDDGAEHMFWGQDRLDLVEAVLGGWRPGQGAPPARGVLPGRPDPVIAPGPASTSASASSDGAEPAVIQFWYDFSSPYAYLASTQIQALAARAGARLEWRPMLLGAVFKELGGPNVPLLAMSESRRRYMGRELDVWASAWQVPFRWNSIFPLRSITALRLALVAGDRIAEASLALFRAAWVDNVDMEDPAQLAGVLGALGLDGAAMLAATREPATKQRLIDLTGEAVKRGVFGAPTFFVAHGGTERQFWGQDRLGLVERAAAGIEPPRS
ncbi:MAG TPA: 2-hydroxychromene-2-carboxylate isomerase [Kofleriaceae bacterium]|nr:2-hydroxychromene-2-carboxylate isomerase [Kofleriaceae bacterium]